MDRLPLDIRFTILERIATTHSAADLFGLLAAMPGAAATHAARPGLLHGIVVRRMDAVQAAIDAKSAAMRAVFPTLYFGAVAARPLRVPARFGTMPAYSSARPLAQQPYRLLVGELLRWAGVRVLLESPARLARALDDPAPFCAALADPERFRREAGGVWYYYVAV